MISLDTIISLTVKQRTYNNMHRAEPVVYKDIWSTSVYMYLSMNVCIAAKIMMKTCLCVCCTYRIVMYVYFVLRYLLNLRRTCRL